MSDTQRITFPELNPIFTADSSDEVLLQVDGESRRATLNTLRSVFAEANSEITIISNDGLEVGMYADFAGDTAPVSYLVCDGSAVSREEYSELFSVIGTKYGAGDGSTTFNLPNKIERFAQGSTTVGEYKAPGLPNIIGTLLGFCRSGYYTPQGAFTITEVGVANEGASSNKSWSGVLNFYADLSNSIYGNSTTVQPPALTVLPCIKAFKVNLSGGSNNSFASYIGQIITTLVPLNNNNVLLLNGQTVNRTDGEDISAFIDYIKLLSLSYPNILISATDYEAALTAIGSCGKFVLDDEAGTLRLPLIQTILEGTTSYSNVGNYILSGLPNITARAWNNKELYNDLWDIETDNMYEGAFYITKDNIARGANLNTNDYKSYLQSFNFDASRSNSIYGSSPIVQPPVIKVLHYIVINNNAGENKANTNLSNLTEAGKAVVTSLPMPGPTAIELTFATNSAYTAPEDGYFSIGGSAVSLGQVRLENETFGYRVGTTVQQGTTYGLILPVRKGHVCRANSDLAVSYFRFQYATGAPQ